MRRREEDEDEEEEEEELVAMQPAITLNMTAKAAKTIK